jgi:hypothetical protein
LFALRDGEQLGHALVEPRQLDDQLRDLRREGFVLSTERRILFPQRLELVHGRVEIILGDPCRSSSALFRSEDAGTIRAALP